MTRRGLAALTLAGVVLGCQADVGSSSDADDDDDEPAMVVVDAWVRPSPATTTDAALYVTFDNGTPIDDHYVAASSDRCVSIVPHLTQIDDDGVASMTALDDSLGLPAGGQLRMEPNGLHLMCLGLERPLTEGESVELEVRFEQHPPLPVVVVVEQR